MGDQEGEKERDGEKEGEWGALLHLSSDPSDPHTDTESIIISYDCLQHVLPYR